MIHGPLTLLMRSVRADALKRRAHFLRLASVILILCFLFFAHFHSSTTSAPGLTFFHSIANLGLALISLAGVGHFCNSITEEKEEGTLGLLLLANISAMGILLGKSTNRILSVLLIFAAQFPFALLAITLGGISVTQIIATFIALGGYLFLIANFGLLMSVWAKRSQEAAAGMVLVLLFLFGFAPAFSESVGRLSKSYLANQTWLINTAARIEKFHQSTSVINQLDAIFTTSGDYSVFSWQFFASIAFGVLAFLVAWISFRRILWAPDVDRPERFILGAKKRRWSPFLGRPWKNAIAWKDFHFMSGGLPGLVIKSLFYGIAGSQCFYFRKEIAKGLQMDGGLLFRDLLLCILSLEVLVLASRFFQIERKSGTLPTLLMLPKTVTRISYAKIVGCLLSLAPTTIALLVTEQILWRQIGADRFVYTDRMVMLICGLLLLSHLTVLCSVIVKWGALPLAIGLSLIAWTMFLPFIAVAMSLIRSANQGEVAEISPMIYATGILCAGIQIEISNRVRRLAGT